MNHGEEVMREFAKQAPTFEDPAYSFADHRLLAWIQDNVPAEPGGVLHLTHRYAIVVARKVADDR